MTPVLWFIGAALVIVGTADLILHIDMIRTARRAKHVQDTLNKPGR